MNCADFEFHKNIWKEKLEFTDTINDGELK